MLECFCRILFRPNSIFIATPQVIPCKPRFLRNAFLITFKGFGVIFFHFPPGFIHHPQIPEGNIIFQFRSFLKELECFAEVLFNSIASVIGVCQRACSPRIFQFVGTFLIIFQTFCDIFFNTIALYAAIADPVERMGIIVFRNFTEKLKCSGLIANCAIPAIIDINRFI